DRVGLLVGRGGEAFAKRLVAEQPDLGGRVHASGELPPADVAAHLRACDLLVQPYPDGVSSRRTSFMAGMALRVPPGPTPGPLTEPLWDEGLAALVPAGDSLALVREAERLLTDAAARRRLGAQARLGYQTNFSLEHTLRLLRETSPRSARRHP